MFELAFFIPNNGLPMKNLADHSFISSYVWDINATYGHHRDQRSIVVAKAKLNYCTLCKVFTCTADQYLGPG